MRNVRGKSCKATYRVPPFFAFVDPVAGYVWVLLGNTLITCAAIFGLRGLYFAVFEEARVPLAMTGTAVGIVSFIGYTPDIFVAAVAGYLIDQSPGALGHQHFFMFLAAFSLLGCITSIVLIRIVNKTKALQT